MRTVIAKYGGIDVLVNCAGVGVGAPISDLPHDEWDRIIGTNLTGVFNCCKAAIPHLKTRGGGWIVNISSLASTNPFPGGAAYCASKAGLNAFSDALMQELRYDNIRVTSILPGSVATGFSGREPGSWRRVEAAAGRCCAGDRRCLESPGAKPAEPRRDQAITTEELEQFYDRSAAARTATDWAPFTSVARLSADRLQQQLQRIDVEHFVTADRRGQRAGAPCPLRSGSPRSA